VLQVAQSYPPEWSGGSTVYVTMLAGELQKRGVRISALCGSRLGPQAAYRLREETHDGYPLARLAYPRRPYGQAHTEQVALAVERLLRGRGIELVHVHCAQGLGEGALLAASRLGIPALVTLHDGAWLCANNHFVNNLSGRVCSANGPAKCLACLAAPVFSWPAREWPRSLAGRSLYTAWVLGRGRRFLELADRLIAICDFIRAQYEAFGVRGRCTTVRTRIPEASLARKPVRPASRPLRLAALGAFRPNKGGPFLARALARLQDLRGDFQLHVWGAVDEEMRRASGAALEKFEVRFHGPYQRAALDAIFAGADVVVHPSVFETYPLTVLEAQASRTPVIAARSHGMREMVGESRGGLLFDPASEEELAGQVRSILEHPGRVAELQAGIPEPEPYSGFVEEHLRIYHELLGGRA
jgi:glycosyltransferase involved in cell wall biosynthesis